jgi:hypothetical protein
MTDNPEKHGDGCVDSIVSAEYHSLAMDEAPGPLNRAVLHSSRKALGNRLSTHWQSAWFRPVASAAVIVLSLAVILEINDASNPESSSSLVEETIQLENSPDIFREAAEGAAGQLRDAEAEASRAAQNSSQADVPATDTAMGNDQTTLLPVEQRCDVDQRSATASWWRCIESLENRGSSALAEQELAALLRTYPAFVEPGQ